MGEAAGQLAFDRVDRRADGGRQVPRLADLEALYGVDQLPFIGEEHLFGAEPERTLRVGERQPGPERDQRGVDVLRKLASLWGRSVPTVVITADYTDSVAPLDAWV